MPDVRKAFPSKFFKAADFEESPTRRVVIKTLKMEKLNDGNRAVLYFSNTDKGLVLNKVNMNRLAEITGSFNSDLWEGWGITLYTTKVDYQGRRVDGIRVSDEKGAYKAPAGAAASEARRAPSRKERPPSEEWDSGEQEPSASPAEDAADDDDIPF